MDRKEFLAVMDAYGDAVVYYMSRKSNRVRYTVCTADLDLAYIQDKAKTLSSASAEPSNEVLVFSWDLNRFKSIDPTHVVNIVKLSDVLEESKP